MFERFTRAARDVVTSAVEEAERRRDRHVGTEHLLLGLARTRAPVVAATLRRYDVDIEAARAALADEDASALAAVGVELDPAVVPGPASVPPASPSRRRRVLRRDHRPFTSGAKSVLEEALAEGRIAGDRRLEAEHILLAMTVRPPRDPALRVLRRLGVDADELRDGLRAGLRG